MDLSRIGDFFRKAIDKTGDFFLLIGRAIKAAALWVKKISIIVWKALKRFFAKAAEIAKKIFGMAKDINAFISPKKIVLPKAVIFFISMFMFSFLVKREMIGGLLILM